MNDLNAKKVRWGILGAGNIARTFATALKGIDEAQLVAVAARSLDKAQEFAGALSI